MSFDEDFGGGTPLAPAAEAAAVARCVRLSQGQVDVLRLVDRHLNSKEIASRLGISSHTVDQRVRGAIRTLGVTRRSEAARVLARFEAQQRSDPQAYQRLIHQPSDIDAELDGAQSDPAIGSQIRHADRTEGVGAGRFETEQRPALRPSLFPWSTPQQPRNGWSVGRRLAAISGIAIAASFSAGMFLAGLESLTRLVTS